MVNPRGEEYFRAMLAVGSPAVESPAARKALAALPPSLPRDLARSVYLLFLEDAPEVLWRAASTTADEHAPTLVECLRGSPSIQASALVAAFDRGGAEALREMGALWVFVAKSSNVPAALKRLPELATSAGVEAAALDAVRARTEEPELGEIVELWSLVAVAARRERAILDELVDRAEAWDHEDVLKRVRRSLGAAKKPKAAAPAPEPSDLPAKGKDVAAFLAAHTPIDGATIARLARRPKQNAAQKAAAICALGRIGGEGALAAITTYRPMKDEDGCFVPEGKFGDTFLDAVAREIAIAWGRFDRRAFAERMFSELTALLFANAGSLDDLRGIEAAAGLHALHAFVGPTCDLAPLSACAELQHLKLNIHSRTGGLAPLTRISGLRVLELINGDALEQDAVETLGEALSVERLALSIGGSIDLRPLLRLTRLEKLRLAAGDRALDEVTVSTVEALVRRGVDVIMHRHEGWPSALVEALEGVTAVTSSGYVGLTRDPSKEDDLAFSMRFGGSIG